MVPMPPRQANLCPSAPTQAQHVVLYGYRIQCACPGRPSTSATRADRAASTSTSGWKWQDTAGVRTVGSVASRTTAVAATSAAAEDSTRDAHARDARIALPDYVARLMDPAAHPELPAVLSPGELGPEHNASLDRIVATMAKHRATWKRSILLFDWLVEGGHEVDERLCGTIIRLCTSRGDSMKALQVYKWMRVNGVPCSVFTYTSVMKAALVGGDFEYALDVFKQASDAIPLEKMDSHIHTLLIEALDRKGDIDRALEIFSDVQDRPDRTSVQVYTATIKAATNAGRVDRAVDIWNDMELEGTKPSAHAYASIIHAHGVGGDWKEAVRKFNEMINSGVRADVVSCTALVGALASNGAWSRAEKFIDWMRGNKVYPNVRTYSILAEAYVKHAEFARASRLFEQMRSGALGSKNRPNEFTYSLMIKRLGEKGKWKEAEGMFLSLQRDILNDTARVDAVDGESSGDGAGDGTLASSSSKHHHHYKPPKVNAVLCSSMMYAYERAGQWERAVDFLAVSDALGFRGNIVIRNILLSALAKAGQMAKAEDVFGTIAEPDGISFETMVAGYGLAGQCTEANAFMKGMAAAGFKPNDYSYCALIAGHSRNGSFNDALDAFNRARDAGIDSVHLYNAMIASCDRFYKYDKAVQLLEEMTSGGVQRNGVTKQLAIGIGSSGVATVQSQQEAILALTAITAAAGGALMRFGVW
jgi:pentatricopeptide repeat protein